jgi:acetyl coenzyme A synthetase (ADP forming)-like protein
MEVLVPVADTPESTATDSITSPNYPSQWESDVVLVDGGTAHVRPIRADDLERLRSLHGRLSPESIYFRFFSPLPRLPERQLHRLVEVDYRDRFALVAVLDGEIVAVVRYDRGAESDTESEAAEVAFVVEDDQQRRGLATLMLEHLAAVARSNGIVRFTAETLPDNRAMMDVFRHAGFDVTSHFDQGVIDVSFPISPTSELDAHIEDRERSAVVASIRRILNPTSIAVVGASRTAGTIGYEIVHNLLRGGFTGAVLPVNPQASSVAGIHAYARVSDAPMAPDLAIIAVPADAVADVIVDCAEAHVGGIVIISAGFAELGELRRSEERALIELARGHGMRVVGPNCMGLANTDPAVRMNATFAPVDPMPGNVAFMTQSGALGISLIDESTRRGIGISSFVSVGNKADISGNDLLRYWEADEATAVIALYLESFGNPRKFVQIASRVARRKPIVAVKSGRSPAGVRGATSHSAALAASDDVSEQVLSRAGVTRVNTLEELFDTTQAFASQPPPKGRRVAIVGNAGGPAILAADAAAAHGLQVPELSQETQTRLASFLPPAAAIRNPVDIVASGSPAAFEQALRTVLDDPEIDAVLAIYVPPLPDRDRLMLDAIATAAASHPDKTMLATVLAGTMTVELDGRRVPTYRFPESAVRALAHMVTRSEWLSNADGTIPPPSTDLTEARSIVGRFLAGDPSGGWLDITTALELADAAGIPITHTEVVNDIDHVAAAAARLGFPVALKAFGPAIVHKTDVGGVKLSLVNEREVADAATAMAEGLGDRLEGYVVQRMAPAGVELLAGLTTDPAFGPLVLFGAGGTAAELLRDRVVRPAPLTSADPAEMVRRLRISPLLDGYRGLPPIDHTELETLLVRLGQLADAVPEVVEIDLNPVIATPQGIHIVDLRVRVEPSVAHPELSVRRLR